MSTEREGARMALEPDALHEDEDGHWLECPRCGSPAYVVEILQEGHCRGFQDETEARDDTDREVGCDATLGLELVWDEE
ncbi:hypothetical protein [Halomarina rubra]|uniref:Small CPxCG-related zinc finger protein n=1 Tax=Halomarina rubra TaxID=2071873 RepID=A0ABD6AW84_9EURY|nr:hypothetical protein [Halomarina rubra]